MNNYKDTTNPREQALEHLAKIENMPRPQNWIAARDFWLTLHPEFKLYEDEFIQACREAREADATNLTGTSKSGSMRNTMKLPSYAYKAMVSIDPDLIHDLSGRNGQALEHISKALYRAFPEYRIARNY